MEESFILIGGELTGLVDVARYTVLDYLEIVGLTYNFGVTVTSASIVSSPIRQLIRSPVRRLARQSLLSDFC